MVEHCHYKTISRLNPMMQALSEKVINVYDAFNISPHFPCCMTMRGMLKNHTRLVPTFKTEFTSIFMARQLGSVICFIIENLKALIYQTKAERIFN